MRTPFRLLRAGTAAALGLSLLTLAGAARAEIRIGVILCLTGPGASLGIPEENALKLWPDTLAGEKVTFTVLNDNTDTATATRNAQRLIQEDKVDMIMGSSLTPMSLAVVETAGPAGVPVISLAGGGAIVLPQDGPRVWAYMLSPTEEISVSMVLDDLVKKGGKTLATIGLANSYGDGFLKVTEKLAKEKGIQLVATEKYNNNDQSVTAQTLKIVAAKPDAVYILSAGTPGALPQMELAQRGYKGPVYQTQGVANNDFLRVGGKDLEGGYMTVAPVLVAEQLPDDNPIKKPAMAFLKAFEGKYGANSRSLFAATVWDALHITEEAAARAMKTAKPGTAEFRKALRDEIEATKDFVGSQAVFTMSPTDHNGVDQRSQVMVRIKDGHWMLQK